MVNITGGIKTSNLSVLIIDKSDFEISTIRRWLQQVGVVKIEATNTTQRAIKLIRKEKYDIILSEYDLVGASGLELFKEIKNMGNYHPCFSVMTSSNDRQTMVELLESTPDDILIKPFSPDSFIKRVLKIIERYKHTKEIRTALNRKEYEQALSLASDNRFEPLVASNQAFSAWLERTKIEIMIKQNRMKNVEQYTDLLLNNKKYDLEWVRTYNIKALLEQKSYDMVIDRARKCLEKYPLSIKSYLFLGDAFYKKNQLKQSTKNYNRALELSKTSISAQRSISRVHHEIGDYENALTSYKRLMQLIEKSVDKCPEDFHQYANLKKESAEMIIDENIDSAIKESIAILKKGQETFPDDIVMDVLSDVMEAQELLHNGKDKDALKKMEETMREFEYVINRNGAALVNSLLTYQQLGQEEKVEQLKERLDDSKDIIDIPLTTLESRFNSFKNQDQESFEKIAELLKSARTSLINKKYDQAILKLKTAAMLAPNSLSIGFMLLEGCIGKLDGQDTVDKIFFGETFSVYKNMRHKTTTEMEERQVLIAGKKLKAIKERKAEFEKANMEKMRQEKERLRVEEEMLSKEKEEIRKQKIEKENTVRKQTILEQQEKLKQERNDDLKQSVLSSKLQNSTASISSDLLVDPVKLDLEAIESVQITRGQLSREQIMLIKKLQSEKRYVDLRKLTFQIKKNIYLKAVKE